MFQLNWVDRLTILISFSPDWNLSWYCEGVCSSGLWFSFSVACLCSACFSDLLLISTIILTGYCERILKNLLDMLNILSRIFAKVATNSAKSLPARVCPLCLLNQYLHCTVVLSNFQHFTDFEMSYWLPNILERSTIIKRFFDHCLDWWPVIRGSGFKVFFNNFIQKPQNLFSWKVIAWF